LSTLGIVFLGLVAPCHDWRRSAVQHLEVAVELLTSAGACRQTHPDASYEYGAKPPLLQLSCLLVLFVLLQIFSLLAAVIGESPRQVWGDAVAAGMVAVCFALQISGCLCKCIG
jgi:hypothetical protein